MSIYYQNRNEPVWLHTSTNHSFAPHLHRQVEFILVLEGSLTTSVDDQTFLLSKGDGLLVFPNHLHSFQTENSSHIFLCIFEVSFCPDFKKNFQNELPKNPTFHLSSAADSYPLSRLLELTAQYDLSKQLPDQIICRIRAYLTLLLADFFPSLEMVKEQKYSDHKLEQDILLYLNTHYTETLSLALLSKEFGVTPYRISHLFSDHFGMSLPCFVTRLRLEYAKEQVLNTDQSITSIGLDAGFGSARTFFREFKAFYQMSPLKMRNQRKMQ